MKGFSQKNINYMIKFAKCYPKYSMIKEKLYKLSWYHHIILMQNVKDEKERLWYIDATIESGWNGKEMLHQIEQNLYSRMQCKGKTNNFYETLFTTKAQKVENMLKDSYLFDFITLPETYTEKELEKELVENMRQFLLELGAGLAFMGQQYKITVDSKDYYLDLLFYHTILKCYIVIELKARDFMPEYAGKLNFYLSAVDDKIRRKEDNETIGILLCKNKDKMTAEYSLRNLNKPIGVSQYNLTKVIPKKLEEQLPSIKQIEKVIEDKFEYYMKKIEERQEVTENKEQETTKVQRRSGINYEEMGKRIKQARRNKKYTQEQLAEKLDISIAFLSRIERGTAHINLSRLSQICEILEVREGDIICGYREKILDFSFAKIQ